MRLVLEVPEGVTPEHHQICGHYTRTQEPVIQIERKALYSLAKSARASDE